MKADLPLNLPTPDNPGIVLEEYRIHVQPLKPQLYSLVARGKLTNTTEGPISGTISVTPLPFQSAELPKPQLSNFKPSGGTVVTLNPGETVDFMIKSKIFVPNPPRKYIIVLSFTPTHPVSGSPIIFRIDPVYLSPYDEHDYVFLQPVSKLPATPNNKKVLKTAVIGLAVGLGLVLLLRRYGK